MNRELEAAARTARLQVEMVAILRELAGVDDTEYCPYCGWGDIHRHTCPVTRARCVLAALDTQEARAARYEINQVEKRTQELLYPAGPFLTLHAARIMAVHQVTGCNLKEAGRWLDERFEDAGKGPRRQAR